MPLFGKPKTIVGLDIGTSKIVALVAEATPEGSLNIIGMGQAPSRGLKKGVVVNIEATVAAVQPLPPLLAIAVTSQYMSTVPVRSDGTPTGPCVLWMDTRGAEHSMSLLTDESFMLFLERHGLIPLPSGNDNLAHAHVLRTRHPQAYESADHLVEAMDYLTGRLTGRVTATQSTVFGQLVCDNRHWGSTEYDPDLVAAAGIDPAREIVVYGNRGAWNPYLVRYAMQYFGGTQDNGTLVFQGSVGWSLITGGDGGDTVWDPDPQTTTLYAALSEIKSVEDKIITIEDPVEYQLRGITQIPINEKKGLTFARGLRSILRHDPDKIMVGEIRDAETAEIAVQAALTGHLVFSTLHTNDAAGAIADPGTLRRASAIGLAPPRDWLERNDAYHFFAPLGDLVRTGPTGTNVGDIMLVLLG